MWTKKVIAVALVSLMLLSIGAVFGTTTVSAADVTVALKKPVGGETWYMGQDYRVSWTFPDGDISKIWFISIGACDFTWWASDNPGMLPPTSCICHVSTSMFMVQPGKMDVTIQVYWDEPSGAVGTATDTHEVTIADGTPPTVTFSSGRSTQVVLGASTTIEAMCGDDQTGVDPFSNVTIKVDGVTAPSDKVTWQIWSIGHYKYDIMTDWLGLGKHKVTMTVQDNAGNIAKATLLVNVVKA